MWTLADRARSRPFAERPEPRGGACRWWSGDGEPFRIGPGQAWYRGQPRTDGGVQPNRGSTKRAAQTSSLPPEGTSVQTSPPVPTPRRRGALIASTEPSSRRTVKSEGRDPLYGRRRVLAWPPDGHPSSIRRDSTACRSEVAEPSDQVGRVRDDRPSAAAEPDIRPQPLHRRSRAPGTRSTSGRVGERHPAGPAVVGSALPGPGLSGVPTSADSPNARYGR